MSENEPNLIKEFRGLYDYIRIIAGHIVKIQNQIEVIEGSISAIKLAHAKLVAESTTELTNIRENMVTKNEINNFMAPLEWNMKETLPPLPTLKDEQPATIKISPEVNNPKDLTELKAELPKREEPSLRKGELKVEESRKETKKRRFPFLRL